MNVSCYIVDDEPHAVEIIKDYVERTPGLELGGFATDPRVALEQVVVPGLADIAFIDIDMPELSGMELAKLVSANTRVVFTTSYREYAVDAFEQEAADYLLKPVSYERFLKAVTRVRRDLLERSAEGGIFFYIRTDVRGKLTRVSVAEIYFVEAKLNYVEIHFSSGVKKAYLTMEEALAWLPEKYFTRVHRSFMVNSRKIQSFVHGHLTLTNQEQVPVGRGFQDRLLEKINSALLKSKRR